MSGIILRKEIFYFFLMVEDKIFKEFILIRIVKGKIREIRVKLRGFEM